MNERVSNREQEKDAKPLKYNEAQLENRYKFMCSLAKSLSGPDLSTLRKLNLMTDKFKEL